MKYEIDAGAGAAGDTTRLAPFADAVRRCEADGTAIWVRGGATLLAGVPDEVATLDVGGLSALVAHAREDMTVTVQAGMTVAPLQGRLADAGQQLPLDVPFADRTTVGGLIATGISGPRRFSRGGVRDLLLGITVIGREGDVFRGGGRVVKNVAGYDLCKLYTGSWGWLGAVVEATFRVAPRPETAAAVAMSLPDSSSAERFVAALLRGPLRPASIDLLNAAAARQLGLRGAALTLVVGFEGMREEVAAQVSELQTDAFAASCERRVLDSAGYEAYCGTAVEIALRPALAVRFNVLSGGVAEWVGGLARGCSDVPVVAHAADGVVWAGFGAAHAAELNASCYEVAARGGSWLIPRGSPAGGPALSMCGPPRPDWALMRRVKAVLDPANVFGRGSPFDRALTSNGA